MGQDTLQKEKYIHGIAYDELAGKNISYTHVINQNNASGTISDTNGFFRVRCEAGDTLFISAMGYQFNLVSVDSLTWTRGDTISVRLVPRSYTLPEVVIYELNTYEKFKKRFVEVQIKPDGIQIPGLPEIEPRGTPRLLDEDYLKSAGFAISSPVSFFYYNFSRKEKNRRLYYELMQHERLKEMANQKFSREKMTEITGLQEPELEEFLEFSHITPEMILRSSDYEIYMLLKENLPVYRAQKATEK